MQLRYKEYKRVRLYFLLLCVIKWIFLSHPILIFDRDLLTTTIRLINLSVFTPNKYLKYFFFVYNFGGTFVKLFTRQFYKNRMLDESYLRYSFYKSFDVYKLISHSLRHNKYWAPRCVISCLRLVLDLIKSFKT